MGVEESDRRRRASVHRRRNAAENPRSFRRETQKLHFNGVYQSAGNAFLDGGANRKRRIFIQNFAQDTAGNQLFREFEPGCEDQQGKDGVYGIERGLQFGVRQDQEFGTVVWKFHPWDQRNGLLLRVDLNLQGWVRDEAD